MMNGKGSKRRPTDEKRFADNYERIFNKKKPVKYVPVRKLERGNGNGS